jgi:hypothetical protein
MEAAMQQSPFFVVVAVISALFGLGFLLIPDQLAILYGTTGNDLASMMGRFFGSALIAVAIIVFMARDLGASPALTGVLWGGLVLSVIDALLTLWSTSTGLLNALGWVTVIVDVLLAAGFAYLLFVRPAST